MNAQSWNARAANALRRAEFALAVCDAHATETLAHLQGMGRERSAGVEADELISRLRSTTLLAR